MKGSILLLLAAALTFISPNVARSQAAEMDSLFQVWNNSANEDSLRLKAIGRLSFLLHQSNPDSSLALAEMQLQMAQKAGLKEFEMVALARKADVFTVTRDLQGFRKTITDRSAICTSYDPGPNLKSRLYYDLATLARKEGDLYSCIDWSLQGLGLLSLIKNDPTTFGKVVNVSHNVGAAVAESSNPDSAARVVDSLCTEYSVDQQYKGVIFIQIGMGLHRVGLLEQAVERQDYAREILESIPDTTPHFLIHMSCMQKAWVVSKLISPDSAITLYKEVITMAQESGVEKILPEAYRLISEQYRTIGDWPNSLEYTDKGLQFALENGIVREEAYASTYLATIYGVFKEWDKAKYYARRCIHLSDSLGMKVLKGSGIRELGVIARGQDSLDLAIDYYNQALEIYLERGLNWGIANIYNDIGQVLMDRCEYVEAIRSFEKSLEIAKSVNDEKHIAWALLSIGRSNAFLGNFRLALDYCLEGNAMVQKMDNLRGKEIGCDCLSLAYAGLGQMQLAYEYQTKRVAILDTMHDEKNANSTKKWELERQRLADSLVAVQDRVELEMAYQAQVAQKEQQRNIYLLIGLGILAAAGFLGLRLQYARRHQKLLKAENEREHAEAQRLQELDKLKTDLYTNITHEFRTPLTVISGMAAELKEDPDKINEVSTIVQRNSAVLLNLVNQMLDLSKVESGNLDVHTVSGDVVEYIGYITQSFQSMAATKDISLHVINKDESLVMDYDPDKLMQILSNLLSNSIKFTPGGGNIYVTTSANGTLDVEVRDTGMGIPEENLPNIFDRFYQVQDTEHKSIAGTGIGLALTKQLVELIGGDIAVSSTVGTGTTFNISLPITKESEETDVDFDPESIKEVASVFAAESIAQKPVAAVVPTLKVLPRLLIIEDNADVQHFLQTILKDHYKITLAPDGKQGVDKALDIIPDIIITDVMMPDKDGYQVCLELKSSERTNHIPIVMLTARADAESRLEGLTKGADAYLAKPFNKEELIIRLEKLIELRRTLQTRYTSGKPVEVQAPTQELDEFIIKLNAFIDQHMADSDFSIAAVCREMTMSRSSLHKKVKALTGRSISLYIRLLRVQRAKALLSTTDMNVSEVAYDVGFSDPQYFSRCFSDEFGMPPSALGS